MCEWLESNNILVDAQCGFRAGRSTTEQVLNICIITETRQRLGLSTFAAFIDFEKAYDSIQHNLLCHKLEQNLVPINLLHIIQCLYDNLMGSVRVNEWYSNPFALLQGLRQGCVLSPTLFNIFINDLPPKLMATSKGIQFGNSYVCCLLYADDLVILGDTAEDLQVLLSCLDEWCHTWKLSINIEKSAIMHFRPKRYLHSSAQFLLNTSTWGLYWMSTSLLKKLLQTG